MSEPLTTVVFDCVVFAQAIINDVGPAAACLNLSRHGIIHLVWSEYVLSEIRELPAKLPARLLITPDKIEDFIQDVATFATMIGDILAPYHHPIDPDDSHYVNLALATGATIITSRDRHLLDLMDPLKPHANQFLQQYPNLKILTPETLLRRIRGK
ncbi:MAG TPA: putative toxin-antitoxin system toxin component, PIN family [Tepidisphaeraceae bacterium]|jgi:putative PIN family toxin of toxin-antitoxin system|nr:putative toxin-antitoxin system toxin component, PIN family [Tepidisphaeraceae bacterium]